MHGVGAEDSVEILGCHGLGLDPALGERGPSRCAAFSVASTFTTGRFGLASAASTACRPNRVTRSALSCREAGLGLPRQAGFPGLFGL